MKRSVLFLLSFFFTSLVFPASQVEFIAEVQSVTPDGGTTVLAMALTPSFNIDVFVTAATEIKDESDDPLTPDQLMAGMVLKIEGLFVEGGILANEVEVTEDEAEFEVRGLIQSLTPDGPESGRMTVAGFDILVPVEAEIKSSAGEVLIFADLMVDQFVKVEGRATADDLVADEVKVRDDESPGKFARIRLEGVVSEIVDEGQFLVELPGEAAALVKIDEETRIIGPGELAVGASVKVFGTLTEELCVLAERVLVKKAVELAPDKLRLALQESGQVCVVLRNARDGDTVFEIASQDPSLATVSTNMLTIPAGMLTACFDVTALDQEGETKIDVVTEGFEGCVEVEVGEQEDEGPQAIRWNPRVIRAAPDLIRDVRLRLAVPAQEETTAMLFISEGDMDLINFPAEVVFPAGSRTQTVRLEFLSTQVTATLTAELPDGEGADLDIDLRPPQMEKLQLQWSPDEVEAGTGKEVTVEIFIDRPAPSDIEVTLNQVGRPLLQGVPGSVVILEGTQSAEVTFMTGEQTGKTKLRAALPIGVGGRHQDLDVQVEKSGD
ncbi:MAG TPA: DUF5666 domain-containing protein [Acidobacteriota bacterium]|nr:DUF5666 domain-containing protein [Acidobacteriota bacterium]